MSDVCVQRNPSLEWDQRTTAEGQKNMQSENAAKILVLVNVTTLKMTTVPRATQSTAHLFRRDLARTSVHAPTEPAARSAGDAQ